MSFDAAAHLAQHGTPEAALNALHRQYEEAQEARDREGRAAQAARRERDAARSELDTAREALRVAEGRAAPEGAVILSAEDAAAWRQVQERGGLSAWDEDRAAAEQGRATERALTVNRAAASLGIPESDLSDYLGDRVPVARTREVDGQTVTDYGLGEGDAFRPLSEVRALQALRGKDPQPPAPIPAPTQQTTTTSGPVDPVADYSRRLFGGPKKETP